MVALAITGALAVTCFVKAFGVTFLARPRSEAAEHAHEVPGSHDHRHGHPHGGLHRSGTRRGLGGAVISSIASSMLAAPSLPVVEGATLVSLDTVSVVSPLIMAALMAVVIALCALVRNAANRKGGMKSDRARGRAAMRRICPWRRSPLRWARTSRPSWGRSTPFATA